MTTPESRTRRRAAPYFVSIGHLSPPRRWICRRCGHVIVSEGAWGGPAKLMAQHHAACKGQSHG